MDEQDQTDSEWSQLELEQQQRYREDLIRSCKREPMDPALFTTPLNLPPLSSKQQRELDLAQAKQLDWALRRIWRE